MLAFQASCIIHNLGSKNIERGEGIVKQGICDCRVRKRN